MFRHRSFGKEIPTGVVKPLFCGQVHSDITQFSGKSERSLVVVVHGSAAIFAYVLGFIHGIAERGGLQDVSLGDDFAIDVEFCISIFAHFFSSQIFKLHL